MPATPLISHAVHPARQARPLALTFTTRLLLTENSWSASAGAAPGVQVETLATQVTVTLQVIHSYRHFGIND